MRELVYFAAVVVGSLGGGVLAGCGAIWVINHVPASWLTDYGEEPSDRVVSAGRQRVPGMPWKWVLSASFAVVGIYMGCTGWQYEAAGLAACWVLVLIAVADGLFLIIPDQFVLLLALTGIGFLPLGSGLISMIAGLGAGGGAMLLIWAVSRAIAGRDAMGFGDVKLCAAAGLALGCRGALFMLVAGTFACGIFAAVRLAGKRAKRRDHVPMGPFLCGAAALYIVVVHAFL